MKELWIENLSFLIVYPLTQCICFLVGSRNKNKVNVAHIKDVAIMALNAIGCVSGIIFEIDL
jgi:hypothetical protein